MTRQLGQDDLQAEETLREATCSSPLRVIRNRIGISQYSPQLTVPQRPVNIPNDHVHGVNGQLDLLDLPLDKRDACGRFPDEGGIVAAVMADVGSVGIQRQVVRKGTNKWQHCKRRLDVGKGDPREC